MFLRRPDVELWQDGLEFLVALPQFPHVERGGEAGGQAGGEGEAGVPGKKKRLSRDKKPAELCFSVRGFHDLLFTVILDNWQSIDTVLLSN